MGGKSILVVLLGVMANGTDSSSHAARVIGNAFSGAAPTEFAALVEVGGLLLITKFLIFITTKTLARINTEEQLRILAEVLRAAEMCVSGGKTSQDEVIEVGILIPLIQLAVWVVKPGSDGSAGHGEMQSATLCCLYSVIAGNANGINQFLNESVVLNLLHAFHESRFPPARTQFCRLFAILVEVGTLAQNLFLDSQVFYSVSNVVKTSVADGLTVCPTELRAAAVWFLRSCMHDNARILQEAREFGLFPCLIELANLALEDMDVCSEVALLLRSAARSSENRELIRQIGGLTFLAKTFVKIQLPLPSGLLGEAAVVAANQKLETASSVDSSVVEEQEKEQRLLDAASQAIVSLCYCDARTIDAVSRDLNAVSVVVAMLASRGDDRDTLHLCATLIPMMCSAPKLGQQNVALLVSSSAMSWLCHRLGELCQDMDGGRARSRGRTPSAGLNSIPPKGMDLLHYRITQKLIVAIGTIAVRNFNGQNAAREGGALGHITKLLVYLKCEAVRRKDPRWETMLISCCDALGHLCKGNERNQRMMRSINGNKQLFHVLGDGDLRNTRLRGAGRDAVEGCASGWSDATDAVNIVIL